MKYHWGIPNANIQYLCLELPVHDACSSLSYRDEDLRPAYRKCVSRCIDEMAYICVYLSESSYFFNCKESTCGI